MYIHYESANEVNGYIDLKDNEVVEILKFIDEKKLNFNVECFSYSMGYEEVCSISRSLEKEAGVLLAVEKEFEYEAVLSKGTFEHTTIVLELADYFSFLVNEKVSAVTLYFSKENIAVAATLKLKRKEAIEQQRFVSETIEFELELFQ